MAQNPIVTPYGDGGYPALAAFTAPVAWDTTGLQAPAAPTVNNAGTGGTVAAGTYGVVITYVSAAGETVASAAATTTTSGSSSTITVTSPAASGGATGWYAYITQADGTTYTRQQAAGSPTAIASNLTLTAPPTSTGAAPPDANTTGGMIKPSPGRLCKAVVTTTLAGTGGDLAFYDGTAPAGTPLLVIPSGAAAGTIYTVDEPAITGLCAAGLKLTAGQVTAGYA